MYEHIGDTGMKSLFLLVLFPLTIFNANAYEIKMSGNIPPEINVEIKGVYMATSEIPVLCGHYASVDGSFRPKEKDLSFNMKRKGNQYSAAFETSSGENDGACSYEFSHVVLTVLTGKEYPPTFYFTNGINKPSGPITISCDSDLQCDLRGNADIDTFRKLELNMKVDIKSRN